MNTLRQAVEEYLNLRRNLGFKLREAGKGLFDFVTYMELHRASHITQALALAWAQQPSNVQPAHWARRLSFVRVFARYRSASDPRTQIPPQGLLPYQPKRARPYLYSDNEIKSLLSAALRMSCRFERGALRPWVFHCLFGLLTQDQIEDVDHAVVVDVGLAAGLALVGHAVAVNVEAVAVGDIALVGDTIEVAITARFVGDVALVADTVAVAVFLTGVGKRTVVQTVGELQRGRLPIALWQR